MSNTVAPEILWAQRSSADEAEKNVVMLTINVPNLPAPPATKFELTSTGFSFNASVGDAAKNIAARSYSFSLEFFDEIDTANSKTHVNDKCLYAVLRKKTAKDEYWPRLTKDKVRLHNVKTDFDKWVDEDEQHDAAADDALDGLGGGMPGMGGMDPSMLGMGGAGGLDLQSMMAQMGGGAGGGMPDFGAADDDDDDDDDADDDADVDDAPAAAAAAEPEAK